MEGWRPDAPCPPAPLHDENRITLRLELGRCISNGEHHSIYDVTAPDAESLPFIVPPLFLKVAKEHKVRSLGDEGAVYKHVYSLQGVVVPRSYGYFSRPINLAEYVVFPWCPCLVQEPTLPPFPRISDGFDMSCMLSLNILLLEKVGGHIVLSVSRVSPELWPVEKKRIKDEIVDMVRDISLLGIPHQDLSCYNVLCAPKGRTALPSLESPKTGRCYEYRLIDFEYSKAGPTEPDEVADNYASEINELLRDIRIWSMQANMLDEEGEEEAGESERGGEEADRVN